MSAPTPPHLYQRQYLVRFLRLRQEARRVVPRGATAAAAAVGRPSHRPLQPRDHLRRLELERARLARGRGRRAVAAVLAGATDLSKSKEHTGLTLRPGRTPARRRARTRSPRVADRRGPPGPLIAARLRTSATFRAILSIAALSFVSASSAIVAVVVAGSGVAPRRRRPLDPGDDRSAAYSVRNRFPGAPERSRRSSGRPRLEFPRARSRIAVVGDERGPAGAHDGTCFIDMAAAAPFVQFSRILVEYSSSRGSRSGEANGGFRTLASNLIKRISAARIFIIFNK